jgi:ABC-type uncharacterized transport system permease subunit
MALGLAVLGVVLLALGLFWPRALAWGGAALLAAGGLEAYGKGPLLTPAQPALLLSGLLALRAETLLLRPRLAPLRRYLLLLALLSALFALEALPHPGAALPWGLALLHAGSFLVAYLALAVGVGAGVLCALQDLRLRRAPWEALKAPPLWSLRRLERGYLRVGYLAVTFGLASGMAWAWDFFGTPLSPDPKEVSVLLGWFLLTLYLLLEERLRGRPRAFLLLLAYGLLLFAFLGAPFLGSRHPSRLPF